MTTPRLLSVVLAVSLVAAACGSDDDAGSDAGSAPTTGAAPATESASTSAETVDSAPTTDRDAATSTAAGTTPAQGEEAEDQAAGEIVADPEEASGSTTVVDPTESGESGVVDLTGAVLDASSTDCADYAGSYTSSSTDVLTGAEYTGALEIVAAESACSISTNQIPNHDMGEGADFRTQPGPVDDEFVVARQPEVNDSQSSLDLGAAVILLNGVRWEAYPAACFGVGPDPLGREAIGCEGNQIDNPWRYNLGSPLNDFGFDIFFAHVQPDGMYHYHSTPVVLYEIDCEGAEVSPVVGFAGDGFPVFGPCFEDADGTIRAAESSYELKSGVREDVSGYTTPTVTGNVVSDEYDGQFIGDYEYVEGSGDLDQCNGMTVDGSYRYHITADYPYVLGCFSGTKSDQFR